MQTVKLSVDVKMVEFVMRIRNNVNAPLDGSEKFALIDASLNFTVLAVNKSVSVLMALPVIT